MVVLVLRCWIQPSTPLLLPTLLCLIGSGLFGRGGGGGGVGGGGGQQQDQLLPFPQPLRCDLVAACLTPSVVWLQARKDAAQFAATQLETLSDKTKTPTSQLKFIMDAWAQVRGARGGHDARAANGAEPALSAGHTCTAHSFTAYG